MSSCVKGKVIPPLEGKKPRFWCKECGVAARKKKHLCEPKKKKPK